MVQFSATKFIQHRNMHQIPSLAIQSALHPHSSPPKLNYPFFVCIYLWGQKFVRDHSEGASRCWVFSLKLSTFVPPSVLIAVGTLFPPEVRPRADLGISATQLGCDTDSPDPAPPSLPSLRSPCLEATQCCTHLDFGTALGLSLADGGDGWFLHSVREKLTFPPALLLHEKLQIPYCWAWLQAAKGNGHWSVHCAPTAEVLQ